MRGKSAFPGPDPIHVHVGLRLREMRIARGLTQAQLGMAVGVTMQQIQKYEKGRNRVSATMIYGLARRLAVPISAFFEGLPDPALGDPSPRDCTEAQ